MKKFKIYAGLGGGFGGATYSYTDEFESEDEASKAAWESAIESYEGYCGLHGLREVGDIMEEDKVDEDEAIEIYNEERETWLDYYVVEAREGVHKTHCCVKHGCKYNEDDCPVVNDRIKQTYNCPECKSFEFE